MTTTAGAAEAAALPHTDAHGCVSRAEYKALHRGMTRYRVARVTGTRGVDGDYRRDRYYKSCRIDAWVVVEYSRALKVTRFYRTGHD